MQKSMMVLIGALVFSLTMMVGCAPFLTAKEAATLTPEQIKAYNEQGLDVYQCLNVSGPPPTGGFTSVLVPKGAKFEVAFASNCNLLTGKVVPK
jgi:hypothetical protein